MTYICKVATIEDIEAKVDLEISKRPENREVLEYNKKEALKRYENKECIAYYGLLDGKNICRCKAAIKPVIVQNAEGLVDDKTAYLFGFRTEDEYQGKGYFSKLYNFMIEDLTKRGYEKVTLGVEPTEIKNKQIYQKYGFTNFIKEGKEEYNDGTKIDVEYYSKTLKK